MALAAPTLAFDITFPGPANYWVACGWNNMTWKSYTTDPRIVTIMLTNSDKHLLNDDFEIGNALQGSSNAAMVYIPCLPAARGYSLMFVNASSYDHKGKSEVLTFSHHVECSQNTDSIARHYLKLQRRKCSTRHLNSSSSQRVARPTLLRDNRAFRAKFSPTFRRPGLYCLPPGLMT